MKNKIQIVLLTISVFGVSFLTSLAIKNSYLVSITTFPCPEGPVKGGHCVGTNRGPTQFDGLSPSQLENLR